MARRRPQARGRGGEGAKPPGGNLEPVEHGVAGFEEHTLGIAVEVCALLPAAKVADS